MMIISDDNRNVVVSPKHIEIVEVDELGFLLKADGVIMGYYRSEKTARQQLKAVIAELCEEHQYICIASSPE